MIALSPLLALALALDLRPAPPRVERPPAHAEETRCGACHTPEGWDRVTFDHARTGFPLEGAHRGAVCRGCHRESDFKRPVPQACVACHRDAHAGRLGSRCANCHDAVAWKQPIFGPEAHRRTNFPLDGRHAVVPCEECHGDRRDRAFSRPTRRCVDCHTGDLARAAIIAFDHSVFGTADECRRCHGPWRFAGAWLPGHDGCFPIRSGTHSGIRCRDCHTSLLPTMFTGVCSDAAGTLNCQRCHGCPAEHPVPINCSASDFSQQCYDCHPSGSAGG